ncbi:MAG: efflux RND transporter periplasmic adaptor subunit [Anaerolineae bacterium]|nr:efflux RND transporter periplasmic adaptor subunit [Anaerolineae bacterium]
MRLKRLALIIGGLVILAVMLCVGGSLLSGIVGGMKAAQPTPTSVATPVGIAVRARGEVVPARWATLYFDASGPVAEWFVEEGEMVKAGTLLGRLEIPDADDLERAVKQEELRLEQARLRLEQLQQPAKEAELRQAEHEVERAAAALEMARLNLTTVQNSPLLNETLEDARKVLQEAENRYRDQQEKYQRGETDYWFVDQAKQNYEKAHKEWLRIKQQADLQLGNARNEVEQAERAYQEAKDRLERLLKGADPYELKAAQLEVEAAQLALERARSALEAAKLLAPFDGTIVTLHLREGDWANVGAPAATIADLSSLRVETTDLDEWGAARIRIGDEATIVVNAFDDKTLTGRVTEIGLRGEKLPAGDVVYRVVIELDKPDPQLRWGMTVRVSIPVKE